MWHYSSTEKAVQAVTFFEQYVHTFLNCDNISHVWNFWDFHSIIRIHVVSDFEFFKLFYTILD